MTANPAARMIPAVLALAGLLLLAACGAEAPYYDPGHIAVTSAPPGAAIFLDGQATGLVTPATLADLDPGIYQVSVELTDFIADPESAPVDVVPLETRSVEFTLSQTGFQINSPVGARILVDGDDTGKVVPATVGGLDPGPVMVSLELDGYLILPVVQEVTIVDQQILVLEDDTFQSRARKTVILEGFSNVSCPPCPQLTENLLVMTSKPEFSADRVQFLEFAVSWPEFTDPFYLANPTENADRFTWYEVLAAPDLLVDGVRMADALNATAMENAVLAAMDEDPGFLIDVTAQFDVPAMPVTVTLTALRDVDLSGYELYVTFYEKEIVIDPAPGLNGQTEFHHVFRDRVDVLPDLGVLTGGATETYELDFTGTSTTEPLYVALAFAQNKTTKVILQAGYYIQPDPTKGKE